MNRRNKDQDLVSSSSAAWIRESSIRALKERFISDGRQPTHKHNLRSFIGNISCILDTEVNHWEGKHKSGNKEDPSRNKHVHIPVYLISKKKGCEIPMNQRLTESFGHRLAIFQQHPPTEAIYLYRDIYLSERSRREKYKTDITQ